MDEVILLSGNHLAPLTIGDNSIQNAFWSIIKEIIADKLILDYPLNRIVSKVVYYYFFLKHIFYKINT